MPRLFTALELPDAVVAKLALTRGGLAGARWLEPEDYHVTLRFIGDIDASQPTTSPRRSEFGRPKTPVRFEGLSWFGGVKPRSLIARVKAGAGADGPAGRTGEALAAHRA